MLHAVPADSSGLKAKVSNLESEVTSNKYKADTLQRQIEQLNNNHAMACESMRLDGENKLDELRRTFLKTREEEYIHTLKFKEEVALACIEALQRQNQDTIDEEARAYKKDLLQRNEEELRKRREHFIQLSERELQTALKRDEERQEMKLQAKLVAGKQTISSLEEELEGLV